MKSLVVAISAFVLLSALGCGASSNGNTPHSKSGSETRGQPSEGDWPSPLLRGPAEGGAPSETSAAPGGEIGDDGAMPLGPKFKVTVPKGWVSKPPRSRMIEHEFAVKPAEGDKEGGRVTVMAAGGSVDDNVERWYGQFTQPDGSKTADKSKRENKEIAGCKVVMVDIPGTFHESQGGGPFAPGPVVELPGYRMLAAIVQTPGANYFIKFTGPEKTVAAQAEAFRKMIEGLTAQ